MSEVYSPTIKNKRKRKNKEENADSFWTLVAGDLFIPLSDPT